MEEDSSPSELTAGEGGGDVTELLPLSEADSGISLVARVAETKGNTPDSSKKDEAIKEPESGVELHSDASPSTSEDVDMGLDLDDEDRKDPCIEAPPKRVRRSPPGDSEDNGSTGTHEETMSIDAEDGLLTLDDALEASSTLKDVENSNHIKLPIVMAPSTSSSSTSASQSSSAGSGKASGRKQGKTSEKCNKDSVKDKKTDSGPSSRQDEERAVSAMDAKVQESSGADPPEELPDLSTDSDGGDTLDSDDDDDDEDEEGAGVVNPDLLTTNQKRVLHRRRGRNRLIGRRGGACSSSSGTDEDPRSDEKLSDNEEEVRRVIQEVMGKPTPMPNWYALRELRKREYCTSVSLGTTWFRERVQSSLQMVRRLVVVDKMKGHEGCVNALHFNRIGTLLASGSDDLDIVLWNWQKGRPSACYYSGHRSNIFQAKFMPFSGDCHVISCARDGQVRLAELTSTGKCVTTRKLAQHRGAAHKLALELDSPHVFLSCGEDALTYLFDLRQEKPHKLVTAKENEKKVPLYSIHSNPCDAHQFCVGGRDHYIRVYDKRKISEQVDGGVLKKFCPDHLVTSDLKANITCACYNYDGSEILGTYNDEDIYLFDNTMSDGANYIHKYSGHRNNATVKGVNFYGPRSEFVVSGSDCGNVYFWDKKTEAIVNFQEGDETGVINVVEPHPSLPVMATSGLDHDVKLWMPAIGEPHINTDSLRKRIKKNQVERNLERVTSEPEIGGQMLWFILHHFQNRVRRRMREEGEEDVTSSDDDDPPSDDSDASRTQCAQS